MKTLKVYDQEHFRIFKDKKIFDVISVDFRSKTVLLDTGKYGEIKRNFSQVNFMDNTEVKDENGKFIHKGHIVSTLDDYFCNEAKKNKNGYNAEIYFEDGCYMANNCDLGSGFELDSTSVKNYSVKIIGNIYENSDLLS